MSALASEAYANRAFYRSGWLCSIIPGLVVQDLAKHLYIEPGSVDTRHRLSVERRGTSARGHECSVAAMGREKRFWSEMAIIYVRTDMHGAHRLRSTAGTQAEKRHVL